MKAFFKAVFSGLRDCELKARWWRKDNEKETKKEQRT
jgi:hypothetical protein